MRDTFVPVGVFVVVIAFFVLGWCAGHIDALKPGPSGYPAVCSEPAKVPQ